MPHLRLFGYPVLERDGARTPIAVPAKALVLLAIVAANHTRPISREWLAQSLWPDADPSDARANLRRHFHLLAKALGEDVFLLRRQTAQWNADCSITADVVRFDALAAGQSALAIAEYAGELCAGVDDEVLDPLRLRYRSTYEDLLRNVIAEARAAGDDAALAVWLQRAINHDPLDEGRVRELMLLRRRHGDRAGALREYNAFAQRLRSELGTEPETETLELFSEIAGESAKGTTPHNLRAPSTTFVGRERELTESAQALRAVRLLTLTGAGGIGKSRLATRLCFDLLPVFHEGVWFVELEHAASTTAIWERIAECMQIAGTEACEKRVTDALAKKRALIVLDTCEHVLDEAREVVLSLFEATHVAVVATSRRILRIADEHVVELGSLEIPPPDLHAGTSPLRYGAYRLFVERAAMVNPTFRVAPRQMRALADILQRVDGLPLAIELVASRANVLTIEGMRKRLELTVRGTNRAQATARAQTIEDAIAWSYELLSNDQRKLLAWTSVFSSPFTIDDVELVCADVPNAADSLLELADASLVTIVADEDDVRYRLLETTRTFAQQRLAEHDAAHAAYLAHATHLAQKADALAALTNAEYDHHVPAIAAGIADYLSALERCVTYRWIALAARILEGVHRYGMRGHFTAELLRLTLAIVETRQADDAVQARLHRFVGAFAPPSGQLSLARAHIELACGYYRDSGEEFRLCETLSALAIIAYESGRYSEAENLLQEVRERAERLSNDALVFKTHGRLGALYLSQRDFERALTHLQPAAAGLKRLGEIHQLGYALKNLAVAAHFAGHQRDAARYAAEALDLPSADIKMRAMVLCLQGAALRECGQTGEAVELQLRACDLLEPLDGCVDLAECLEDIAATLASLGELADAARALGYSEALRKRVGTEINPGLRDYYETTVQRLESGLGARLAAERSAGALSNIETLVFSLRAALRRSLAAESEDTTSLS